MRTRRQRHNIVTMTTARSNRPLLRPLQVRNHNNIRSKNATANDKAEPYKAATNSYVALSSYSGPLKLQNTRVESG